MAITQGCLISLYCLEHHVDKGENREINGGDITFPKDARKGKETLFLAGALSRLGV